MQTKFTVKPEWSKFIEKDGRDFTFLEVIHICVLETERVV